MKKNKKCKPTVLKVSKKTIYQWSQILNLIILKRQKAALKFEGDFTYAYTLYLRT